MASHLIYVVENDSDDATFLMHAVSAVMPTAVIKQFWDGDEVLDHFTKHTDTLPSLVLLDLTLRKVHAKTVLQTIKSSKKLKEIPVIILTGSASTTVKDEMTSLGANDFYYKPNAITQYTELVRQIKNKWLGL
jgi:two-component system, OmpR family, alkaline phosphatase synthesis response regulator PhoP